ncbi:MAG: hypothetical protein A2Y56_07555 [Candidatus Aminicenantes bacterium RBG_13_63_10]|nr:MAG: hypothetical protein A2Y56_07555 [Candidatus Aminicenantes bacterium RBG_13_63_10]
MKHRGFTLIETLISLALAAFLMTGTAELMLRAAYLKKKSDIVTAAAGIARDKLAQLRGRPFDGPELDEGEGEEIVTDQATGRAFRLTWAVELQGEGLKTVRVRAAPDRTPERGVGLEMLLVRSLGF